MDESGRGHESRLHATQYFILLAAAPFIGFDDSNLSTDNKKGRAWAWPCRAAVGQLPFLKKKKTEKDVPRTR